MFDVLRQIILFHSWLKESQGAGLACPCVIYRGSLVKSLFLNIIDNKKTFLFLKEGFFM
jgi:hypothetical protein